MICEDSGLCSIRLPKCLSRLRILQQGSSQSIYTPEDVENLKNFRIKELKKEIDEQDMELLKVAFQRGEL